MHPEKVVQDMRRWLERAVIGLNLCPYAKAVYVKDQVRLAVSAAEDANALLDELAVELDGLLTADPRTRDTTLLIAPLCLHDFLEFNAFLPRAERLLRKRGLEGAIQLASFHPEYRFADADEDDPGNFSNRAPYPTLHLLREESIERAVAAFPDAATIYETNIATLRRLGKQGWAALGVGRSP